MSGRSARRPDNMLYDREKCRVCGYLRINVRHNTNPANQHEGKDYYDQMRDELHEFLPSGEYER